MGSVLKYTQAILFQINLTCILRIMIILIKRNLHDLEGPRSFDVVTVCSWSAELNQMARRKRVTGRVQVALKCQEQNGIFVELDWLRL